MAGGPSKLDYALAWAARGFPVFPLRVGGKDPALKGNWKDMATCDPERIKGLWGRREYNIGVLSADHIIVDIDDKPGKTGSADWSLFGYPDDTLTVGTPSGGRHIYYHCDKATGQPALTRSIDIRAAGQGYVIAPGSEVGGKAYTLLKDVPVLEAPESLVEHCQQRKRREGPVIGEMDADEALAQAEAYLAGRNGSPEGNRDNWTYVTACSVIDFGVSADMCFELLLQWNEEKNAPPLSEEAIRRIADSAWRNRLTPPGSFSIAAEFDSVHIPEPEQRPCTRPKVMWAGDPSLDLSQQWLMFNRFPRVGTAMLVGPSGSGKTFLSLDLAVALAEGREWLGKTGDESVGAVVLSGEGIGGLPARMKPLARVPVVAATVGLINSEAAAAEVRETLVELRAEMRVRFDARLGLIVIDTLTAAGILENENDNSEIGRAIKVLEQMAVAFDCLVLVTHHPPKRGTGARGGYALHAGFDTVVEIFHQERRHERFVECIKGRDAPIGAWGSFVLEPYVVEPDLSGRGRDITTQRIIYGTEKRESAQLKAPPPNRLDTFFGTFFDVRAEMGLDLDAPVPLDRFKARFTVLVAGRKGSPSKSLRDCLEFASATRRIKLFTDDGKDFIVESESEVEE